MKLFILKLLSLAVFCLGLVSLGIALGLPEIQSYLIEPALEFLASTQEKLPPALDFLKGALTPQGLWFTGSVVAIVLGIYGFFPRMAKYRKPKKIAYEGPHGEVQIQLESVEHSLNQVLARMPEIKKINVRVDPQDNGRKALIRADVILYQQPGQNARAIASLVSDYIAETATKLLGLEELANIDLNVTGIVVNTRKSSKAIRKESLSHSGNAPVELLEAAPTPLTLSGPNDQPLGSGPIEEELDEDAESEGAMDANAVDTRQDESNQAAARSELLEPLSMGESGTDHRNEAEEESPSTGAPNDANDPGQGGIDPLQMDGLDESLDDGEPEDDQNEVADDDTATHVDEAPDQDAEDTDDETGADVTGSLDSDEQPAPAFASDSGITDNFAPEAAPVESGTDEAPESPAYPWEGGEATPTATDESENSGFQPGFDDHETTDATDSPDSTDETLHTDSVMGELPGEVTIPEQDEATDANESDQEPSDGEKKRWGGWFN